MIHIATIGTSVITQKFAAAVAQVDGIEIGTVFSRAGDKARSFAEEIGAPAWSDDLDAVLADPETDAVYIASPNSLHVAQARRALAAGKHVFVEKPAAASASEWAEVVADAADAGRILFEGMRTAYDPGIAALREMLPSVGAARRASLHYQKRSSRYDDVLAGRTPNIFDPAMGGGALADLGVYVVRAALVLFGVPTAVQAATVPLSTGADGAGAALLTYPELVVDLAWSKITDSARPSEIQGEEGTIVIDHISSPRSITVTDRDGTATSWTSDEALETMTGEVARFAELVTTGGSAAADNEASLDTLRIVDQIRAAATAARVTETG